MVKYKSSNKKVLFISYDGLKDPLGQSQVLPYIKLIAKRVDYIHIISFEKKNLNNNETVILPKNSDWTECHFSQGGFIYKVLDLCTMLWKGLFLFKKHNFNIVHARSYPSMHTAYFLSKIFNFKIIFDMRGFWADDRVEGKLWPQNKIFYKALFKYYKVLELKFLNRADAIVVLTKKAQLELYKFSSKIKNKSFIIPCCADYNHFKPFSINKQLIFKSRLKIPVNATVISYLGSVGTVYLFDQMIRFFNMVLSQNKGKKFVFLIITRESKNNLKKKIIDLGFSSILNKIRIVSAFRSQVPSFLGLSDLMITFRLPSYSQLGASPTKIGEAFAMGVPVISNKGIGDVDDIIKKFDGGLTFNINSYDEFKQATKNIFKVKTKGGRRLRKLTYSNFSIYSADYLYGDVYNSIKNVKQ